MGKLEQLEVAINEVSDPEKAEELEQALESIKVTNANFERVEKTFRKVSSVVTEQVEEIVEEKCAEMFRTIPKDIGSQVYMLKLAVGDLVEERANEITDDVIKAEDLPMVPRGSLNFKDQGNLKAAPVDVGAIGEVKGQVIAPPPNDSEMAARLLRFLQQLGRSDMNGQTSTLAQQSDHSPCTLEGTSRQKRKQRQSRMKKNALQLRKPLEALQPGESTSEQPETRPAGSTRSSLEH